MIKGINKQILEVTNPDSPYFEKIIFFVKPNGQAVDEEKLKSEAIKVSTQIKKPPKSRKTKKQIFQTLTMIALGLCAGISLAITLSALI